VQEIIIAENKTYKDQFLNLKKERDEAQQKCLVLEQIIRHYK